MTTPSTTERLAVNMATVLSTTAAILEQPEVSREQLIKTAAHLRGCAADILEYTKEAEALRRRQENGTHR